MAPLSQSGKGVLDQLRGGPPASTQPVAKRAASAAVEIGAKVMAQATSTGTLATTEAGAAFDGA